MGEMIWCKKCDTVVWAYDHWTTQFGRVVNPLKLPCPKCGAKQYFDSINGEDLGWQALEKIAKRRNLEWDISGDLSWAGIGKDVRIADVK